MISVSSYANGKKLDNKRKRQRTFLAKKCKEQNLQKMIRLHERTIIMKNTKRYIAFVTSVIMAVSMFTGCGEAQSDTAVTNEQKNVGPTNSPRKNSNKKNDEMTMGDTAEADDNTCRLFAHF